MAAAQPALDEANNCHAADMQRSTGTADASSSTPVDSGACNSAKLLSTCKSLSLAKYAVINCIFSELYE